MKLSEMILYSDEDILVVNKSSGELVLKDRWDMDIICLTDRLEKDWGRTMVVHRLDKETSGVILLARNEEAHKNINDQFAAHTVKKTYLCLSSSKPEWTQMECDLPLRPDGDKFHRTVVDRDGKPSLTSFTVLESGRSWAWIEALPRTGRTHQIRAHLWALKCALFGDELYHGPVLKLSEIKRGYHPGTFETPLLERAGLHAAALELIHPRTGLPMKWEAPLPKDLETSLKQLRIGID